MGKVEQLADMRATVVRQLEARVTIYRVGNGLHYNDDDAAYDELAAKAIRKQLLSEGIIP